MNEKMLPCPFCKADHTDDLYQIHDGRWSLFISIPSCVFDIECGFFKTREDAIEAWNNGLKETEK